MVDERRLEVVSRNRGIKKAKDSDSTRKLRSAYIRKAEESELGRELVNGRTTFLTDTAGRRQVLKEPAAYYRVDTDAITLKVKHEFTAKENARIANKANPKQPTKAAKKSTAA